MGEDDRGFEWLNRGFRDRDSTLVEIKADPSFDRVRSDPRFVELMKKVGLPTGPQSPS